MTEIQNIHDKYFKEVFSRKDVALDMLRMLSPKLLRKLDLRRFKLSKTSFVDESLKENFADLIYDCQTKKGEKIKISFIFEHKSYLETHPHLQLLQYFLNVWNQNRKQKENLTTLIPVIIYHGQSRWENKPLSEYFSSNEALYKRFIPEFEYLLFDLSIFTNQQIEQFTNKFLAVSSLIMKHVQREKYYLEIINEFVKLFENLEEDENFVKTTLIYLTQTSGISKSDFVLIFQQASIKINNRMLTVYEQLIQEGETRGEMRGISLGVSMTHSTFIKNLHKRGFTKDQIIEQMIFGFDISKKQANQLVNQVLK
jgi:predicted transposase/invertase (TIGR01784 family)